jgi:uncharacterized protein
MSLTLAITVGVVMGIVFGFALEKSRVFEPGIIVCQMQMQNFIMLKVFLSAVATGAIILAVLNGFGYVKLQPKAALYAADIVGGLLLGAGITLAGACPGTTFAQIGAGYRDALFTLVGGLVGTITYSYAEPVLSKTFLAQGSGKIIFTDLFGIPYWTGALALAGAIIVILFVLEAWRPWRGEMGNDVDGDIKSTTAAAPRNIHAVPAE